MKYLFYFMALIAPACAIAGDVVSADVEYRDERYFVAIESVVNADPEKIYDLLTDFNHLTKLNPDIKESHVIFSLDENTHRTHIVTDSCITFYCKKITLQQDVEELGRGIIVTTVVPDKSDFVYGHARWKIEDNGNHTTRIYYSNDMKPKFFVPPLIGPLLIKDKLREEVLATINGLERLAEQNPE